METEDSITVEATEMCSIELDPAGHIDTKYWSVEFTLQDNTTFNINVDHEYIKFPYIVTLTLDEAREYWSFLIDKCNGEEVWDN